MANNPYITPPHLPPPSSSIELHRRARALKVFIAVSAISVVAGFSGAAMLLGWVWPRIELGAFGSTALRPISGRQLLDESTRRNIAPMLMQVYNGASTVSGATVLKQEQFLAPALVVGSDGWIVLYHPAGAAAVKNWQTLVGLNNRFKAVSAIADQLSGLLYVRVEPVNGFTEPLKPAIFQTNISLGDQLFAWDGFDWQAATVIGVRPQGSANAHLDTAPAVRYIVNAQLEPGSVVVTQDGNVAGVVTQNGTILPAEHISRVWALVHENGEVHYPSLGLEGWFNTEMPFFVGNNAAQGFLVNRVLEASSTLQRGDVITEVNGAPMSSDALWDFLRSPTVRLTVWRSGSSSVVVAPVSEWPKP